MTKVLNIIKKFVLVLLVTVSVVTGINVNANTSLPQTIKMKSDFTKIGDNAYGFNQNYFYMKQVNDGTYAYCSGDTHHKAPKGQTMTLKGQVDAGYAYLLANGYPNKSFTGDAKKDYFITQQAVWLYNGAISSSKSSKNPDMVTAIYNLYNAAKALKGKKQTVITPSVTLSVANLGMSKQGNYYVSEKVTPTVNGDTYTVSATNGAIIKDVNGNTVSSLRRGESFYVYATKVGDTKVTVTTTVKNVLFYEYKPSSSTYQSVIVTYQYETTDSASASLTFSAVDTKLKISKTDATNGKELPGATLVLKDSKGNEVDKWVSTNEPHYIEGLEPGSYTLCETIAPAGYKLKTTCITFNLRADGVTKTVTMENELKDLTTIKVSKQDITSKKELPGATLVVKDSTGKEIDKWVSTNEPHYVKGLKEGTYTLTETIAPEGYILSTETIKFTVSRDGKTSTVVMYNQLKDLTKIKVSKQDITTKKELPGATLVVKDSNGNVIDKWVSTNEPHYVKGLKNGTYTLTETIAPAGYVLSTETIKFTVKNDALEKTVVMYNQLKDLTKIKISKQDITTKKELPGATLTVKDSNGNVIDKWVSTNEPHYLENLKEGKYTLTEEIAPEGYTLSKETIEFNVTHDGLEKTVVMYNTRENLTIIKVSKQDITNQKELPGATLVVKDSNGNVVDKWVSTNEPHYVTGLTEGKYTLTEEKAPEGYALSSEAIEFTVSHDGKIKTVVMFNTPVTRLLISKQDITTKKELPGATLELKDAKGNIIETWVSGKEPHYFEGLEVGTYTLTEKIAPKGYELSEETIEFEVKNDGKITKVVMYNTPYTPVPITSLNANPFIIALGFILSFFGLGMVFKNVKTREE